MTATTRPFFLSLLLTACTILGPLAALAMPPLAEAVVPATPDYAQEASWLAKPATPTHKVDVFFVYPTILFDDVNWFMDPSDPAMRAAARGTLVQQASVFEGQANIYAPVYRQMNIAALGLSDEDAAPIQKIVHDDVWSAFTHYLKYENKGRPFFLAGHSQGSMILTDLMLDHWGSLGVEKRLVAALLPGWSMTTDNLAGNPNIAMCERPDQTGCVISYNTMAAGRQKAAPTLLPGEVAVNPLTWTLDNDLASAELNLGAVFFDANNTPTTYPHFTSAQIVDGGLVVQPKDVQLVTVEGGHFPSGIYHAFDYSLFFENLRENIARRIAAMPH